MKRSQRWWDRYFLGLCQHVATASKDPSTKVGACIIDPQRRVVSVGYNGFARGVKDRKRDYACRKTKLLKTVHAERNALLFAGRSLEGCTLYTWPFGSCAACAAMVIQSGITRVVSPPLSVELAERWAEDVALAREQFNEAGVKVVEVRE